MYKFAIFELKWKAIMSPYTLCPLRIPPVPRVMIHLLNLCKPVLRPSARSSLKRLKQEDSTLLLLSNVFKTLEPLPLRQMIFSSNSRRMQCTDSKMDLPQLEKLSQGHKTNQVSTLSSLLMPSLGLNFIRKLQTLSMGLMSASLDHLLHWETWRKSLILQSLIQLLFLPIYSWRPHLQEYLRTTHAEGHLEETWKLHQLYSTEKAVDAIIDLMQCQPMPDPLPRSIWKDIILDKYFDFEKLHASMDRGYDHDDVPKDFGGGYSIVRKDHFHAKKPVQTESEWVRVAQTWRHGVELLFPHRKNELTVYMKIIEELFRAAPQSPSIAICIDVEARDNYAKHPYRMDDRNQLHSSILAQMFRAPTSQPTSGGKRRGSPVSSTGKKPRLICRNWNLGYCNDLFVRAVVQGTRHIRVPFFF